MPPTTVPLGLLGHLPPSNGKPGHPTVTRQSAQDRTRRETTHADCGSQTRAAAAVRVHVSTLRYPIDRIERPARRHPAR
ncbi:hypothetical protein [Kibdelosporangium aridum]|uniref:hypothetical protein n=1 Tax=Kibdelosporangium aridum TaxID=2030 RepID=UPI000F7B8C07|nr:hypothetical protein [Kibdelosporangium aridum]